MDPNVLSETSKIFPILQVLSPFLSGLVTGLVALVVLWRNNVANDRRIETQIAHDKSVRKRDFLLGLKSDMYAEVLSSVDDCLSYLENLHKDVDLENNKPDDYCQEKLMVMSRMSLVANDELRELANGIRKGIIIAGFNLYNDAVPIHEKYDVIKNIKTEFDEANNELSRIRVGGQGVFEYSAGDRDRAIGLNGRLKHLIELVEKERREQGELVSVFRGRVDAELEEVWKMKKKLLHFMQKDLEVGK